MRSYDKREKRGLNVLGVGVVIIPVYLIQPLKGLVPALPAVWVGPMIRGGSSCRDCGDRGAWGCYGKTGRIERGEGVWGIDDGGRRGEMGGEVFPSLGGFRPSIFWGTRAT